MSTSRDTSGVAGPPAAPLPTGRHALSSEDAGSPHGVAARPRTAGPSPVPRPRATGARPCDAPRVAPTAGGGPHYDGHPHVPFGAPPFGTRRRAGREGPAPHDGAAGGPGAVAQPAGDDADGALRGSRSSRTAGPARPAVSTLRAPGDTGRARTTGRSSGGGRTGEAGRSGDTGRAGETGRSGEMGRTRTTGRSGGGGRLSGTGRPGDIGGPGESGRPRATSRIGEAGPICAPAGRVGGGRGGASGRAGGVAWPTAARRGRTPRGATGRAGVAGAVLEATALVLGVLGLLCAVLPLADPGLLAAAAPSAGPVPPTEVAGSVGVPAWPLAAVGPAAGMFGIARAGSGRRGVAVAGTVLSALGLVVALAQLPAGAVL